MDLRYFKFIQAEKIERRDTNTVVAAELRQGTAVSDRPLQFAVVPELHPFVATVTHDCACTRKVIHIKA
jgi:hypothetical protein